MTCEHRLRDGKLCGAPATKVCGVCDQPVCAHHAKVHDAWKGGVA